MLGSAHRVVGVITQPDRPAGRGLHLIPPDVKVVAALQGIPVFQPEKLNRPETIEKLNEWKPDILVVVAFSGFLGEALLKYCRLPPINVHPSLLPDLRGAAPMQWALLRGYSSTGISTQFMAKEMDAGDVLLQINVDISPTETYPSLHDRCKELGGKLLVETLDKLEANQIVPAQQDHTRVTFAPLLTKEQGCIHWSTEDSETISNKVRALNPWPSAYSWLHGKRIKINSCLPSKRKDLSPGEASLENDRIFIGTVNGAIEVLSLQPEGKGAQTAKEFVLGANSNKTQLRQMKFSEEKTHG